MSPYRAVMHSFDTTIQLVAIRQDELRQAASRGRIARLSARRRNRRGATRTKEA
jgi:hypothetical protein